MGLASSAIIGAVVSLIVQETKKRFGTSNNTTIMTVVALSVALGTAYHFLEGTAVWESIIQIMSFAGSIYVFFLRQFEK